ncbi:MAG: dihydrodipicolinate synthase family protein [Actinobacteria bacterium]|nr:dihydrodipicolinate synthase family protein [Actinomycetota bacterium]
MIESAPPNPDRPKETLGIRGVMVALATPLDEHGEIDRIGLERLVAHVISAGVSGICPVGSTGEGPLLSREQRREVTATVARVVSATSATAVIPATVSITANDVIADLMAYHDVGATAALVPPPFYYPLENDAVKRFFEQVADRSPMPLLLYNIPAMTKVPIPATVVGELAQHPMIVGIKDSSRDLEYFQAVVMATQAYKGTKEPDLGGFATLTGSDTLLVASMLCGGAGTIAASVNLVPSLVLKLYQSVRGGDYDLARPIQERLVYIVQACRRPGFPAGWKAALELVGLCGRWMAHPLSPATPPALERLAAELRALEVLEG